ncbi:hypothetical protein ACF064_32445 [Streptomyces sp. NPDC015492]|uniref:hypothetical protein n=1 Tax=Streptomyces sp. NPDC015492 TaxID=3364958 RepID=UPI003701282C
MNDDLTLSYAFKAAAAAVPVGSVPMDAVVRRGRRIRRRRQALRSAAVAAALLVPFAGAGISSTVFGRSDTTALPAVPVGTSVTPTVMAAGEKVPFGRGHSMWLTDGSLSVVAPKPMSDVRMTVEEVPWGHISATATANTSGTLWTGIYRGPGRPARVTIVADGRTPTVRAATLPGNPDWIAFVADDPNPVDSTQALTMTVQAGDGTILASLTKTPRS